MNVYCLHVLRTLFLILCRFVYDIQTIKLHAIINNHSANRYYRYISHCPHLPQQVHEHHLAALALELVYEVVGAQVEEGGAELVAQGVHQHALA